MGHCFRETLKHLLGVSRNPIEARREVVLASCPAPESDKRDKVEVISTTFDKTEMREKLDAAKDNIVLPP